MKDDIPIIKEIIRHSESIENAKEYFGDDLDSFLNNEHYQNSCLYSFVQIGENVKRLSKELTKHHNTVEWSEIAGFRDYVVHNYGGIKMTSVWDTMNKDLPELLMTCKMIVQESESKKGGVAHK